MLNQSNQKKKRVARNPMAAVTVSRRENQFLNCCVCGTMRVNSSMSINFILILQIIIQHWIYLNFSMTINDYQLMWMTCERRCCQLIILLLLNDFIRIYMHQEMMMMMMMRKQKLIYSNNWCAFNRKMSWNILAILR